MATDLKEERVARGYTVWLAENWPSIEVNVDTWGDDIEAESLTKAQVMGHLLFFIEWAQKHDWRDEELFEHFKDWFTDITLEMFTTMNKPAAQVLRNHLMSKGIFVAAGRKGNCTKVLYDVCQQEELTEWTVPQIKKQEASKAGLDSRFQSKLTQDVARERTAFVEETPERGTQTSLVTESVNITPLRAESIAAPAPSPPLQGPSLYNPEIARGMAADRDRVIQLEKVVPVERVKTAEEILRDSEKRIEGISKYYSYNKQNKYSGAEFQFLHKKLNIFDDQCRRFTDEEKCVAFPSMLEGNANDYYYESLANNNFSFITMICKVQDKFETKARSSAYMTKWREATLKNIRRTHNDKSLVECFDLLVSTMNKIRPGLSKVDLRDRKKISILLTDDYAKEALLNACEGIPETNMAKFNDPGDYEETQTKLRESIVATSGSSGDIQYTMDTIGEIPNEIFDDTCYMVERMYNKYRGGMRGSYGGGYRGRVSTGGGAYRSLRGGRANGASGGGMGSGQRRGGFMRGGNRTNRSNILRKCYVCGGTDGHSSWDHPQDEQDTSKTEWIAKQKAAGYTTSEEVYLCSVAAFESHDGSIDWVDKDETTGLDEDRVHFADGDTSS